MHYVNDRVPTRDLRSIASTNYHRAAKAVAKFWVGSGCSGQYHAETELDRRYHSIIWGWQWTTESHYTQDPITKGVTWTVWAWKECSNNNSTTWRTSGFLMDIYNSGGPTRQQSTLACGE